MTRSILHITASARHQGSVSRKLTNRLISRYPDANIITRDVSTGMPHLNEDWVSGTFTPPEMRSDAQNQALAFSDALVAEIQASDVIVIGFAMYNFALPSALKAWIDQIARAGVTFHYTENGPEGLLQGKQAVLVMASGGTPAGAPQDFATPYLKHVLGFMGINQVTVINAAAMGDKAETAIEKAGLVLDELNLAA